MGDTGLAVGLKEADEEGGESKLVSSFLQQATGVY